MHKHTPNVKSPTHNISLKAECETKTSQNRLNKPQVPQEL